MRKNAMPDTSFLMVWKVLIFGVSSVCIPLISSTWENIHAPCGSRHMEEGTADYPPFLIQFSADNRKWAWKNAVGFYAYGVGKQEKGADILRISALWACQYLIFWLRTAFPASENIDFTDFLHVFLLGGRESDCLFYNQSDWPQAHEIDCRVRLLHLFQLPSGNKMNEPWELNIRLPAGINVCYTDFTESQEYIKGGLPSIPRRGLTLQTKERRAMPMVTYSDLIQFCILIVALVGLCYTIFGKRK